MSTQRLPKRLPDVILHRSFTRPSTALGDRRPGNEASLHCCWERGYWLHSWWTTHKTLPFCPVSITSFLLEKDTTVSVYTYSRMSVIWTSDIQTHWSTERPSNYCFLINAHIPWHQLHEKMALHVCILPRLIVGGLAFSSFAVLSSSLLYLWPCLRCGSENVVYKLLKNESVVCWVLSFRLTEYS